MRRRAFANPRISFRSSDSSRLALTKAILISLEIEGEPHHREDRGAGQQLRRTLARWQRLARRPAAFARSRCHWLRQQDVENQLKIVRSESATG